MAAMSEAGIGTAKYYPSHCTSSPPMSGSGRYPDGSLPVAELCNERTFALPGFPGITAAQQEEVAGVVREALLRG